MAHLDVHNPDDCEAALVAAFLSKATGRTLNRTGWSSHGPGQQEWDRLMRNLMANVCHRNQHVARREFRIARFCAARAGEEVAGKMPVDVPENEFCLACKAVELEYWKDFAGPLCPKV